MPSLSSPSFPRDVSSRADRHALRADQRSENAEARYWLKAILLNGLVLTLLGLVTYGPAASLQYGRADDYWLLLNNATYTPESAARVWIEAGRFIPAFATTWLFPSVDTVPELLYLRLIAIVALSLTGLGMSMMTLRLLGSPRSPVLRALALIVGLVALVTPAAPSAATWAVMAVQLWALPFALAGGLVATTQRALLGLRWDISAGLLILLATFTYQPAAAASLLPVFMWSALRWARYQPPQWRRPVVVSALLVASLACNVAIVKLFHWAGNDRLGGHGLGESLLWFVAGYLPRTIDFGVPVSVGSLALTLILLITALLSPLTRGRRLLALPGAVLCAWLFASAIVVPGELWATYRLVMTPQTMLWSGSAVCLALAVQQWQIAKPQSARSVLAVLGTGTIVVMAVSSFRAYSYLARPNAVDWASVQCVLRESAPLSETHVLVLNPFRASTSPVRASDEYGLIASSIDWALPDMAWVAAESIDQDHLPPEVESGKLKVVDGSSLQAGDPHGLRFRQDICGGLQPASKSVPYWESGR